MSSFKTALVSVSDKNNLSSFLKPLCKEGLQVISTGGTKTHLEEKSIPVTGISDFTGFPEVMEGRVKTLHPHVHMALLARSHKKEDFEVLKKHKLPPIDLVVVNLYPFQEHLQKNLNSRDLLEFIDIGGPTLLRAAAKNYERVVVICDPEDYKKIKSEVSLEERRRLAGKAFRHVSLYDDMIASYLEGEGRSSFTLSGSKVCDLRYGENPHQRSSWYQKSGEKKGWHNAQILQGKPLSYNNILDLEASVRTIRQMSKNPCFVGIKHNSPCGVAWGSSLEEACKKGLKSDPMSIFGGIVSLNSEVSKDVAENLCSIFLECVVAPSYSKEALKVFEEKKNLRVVKWENLNQKTSSLELRTIEGGFLTQEPDETFDEWQEGWGFQDLDEKLKKDLLFAWKIVARLKSNAVTLVSGGQSVGLGMGQVSRIDAVKQALSKMKAFHPKVKDVVLASDGYFPFVDSVEYLASEGVRFVIQPGGSIKDEEILKAAKKLGVNMILTSRRHFLH